MPFPSALNAARFPKVMWVDEEVSEHLVAVKKHWKTRLLRGLAFNHLIVKIATRLLPHPTGVCFPLTFHLQAVNFSVNICFFVSSSICKSINTPAVETIPLPKTHLLFRAEGPPPSPADRFGRSSSGRFLPRVLTRPATWHAVSLSPGHTSLGLTSQGWQWPGSRNHGQSSSLKYWYCLKHRQQAIGRALCCSTEPRASCRETQAPRAHTP